MGIDFSACRGQVDIQAFQAQLGGPVLFKDLQDPTPARLKGPRQHAHGMTLCDQIDIVGKRNSQKQIAHTAPDQKETGAVGCSHLAGLT